MFNMGNRFYILNFALFYVCLVHKRTWSDRFIILFATEKDPDLAYIDSSPVKFIFSVLKRENNPQHKLPGVNQRVFTKAFIWYKQTLFVSNKCFCKHTLVHLGQFVLWVIFLWSTKCTAFQGPRAFSEMLVSALAPI